MECVALEEGELVILCDDLVFVEQITRSMQFTLSAGFCWGGDCVVVLAWCQNPPKRSGEPTAGTKMVSLPLCFEANSGSLRNIFSYKIMCLAKNNLLMNSLISYLFASK